MPSLLPPARLGRLQGAAGVALRGAGVRGARPGHRLELRLQGDQRPGRRLCRVEIFVANQGSFWGLANRKEGKRSQEERQSQSTS